MICIGLTGGIGSGKSTVAKIFAHRGVPVYCADTAGKRLMNTSFELQQSIVETFGKESYPEGHLDARYLSSIVFDDPKALKQLTTLVHPVVKTDYQQWLQQQHTNFCIYESAIIFESQLSHLFDAIILVIAPEKLRIQRVIQRDNTTAQEVIKRIKLQWSDDQKKPVAQFVIQNTDLQETKDQVESIYRAMIEQFMV